MRYQVYRGEAIAELEAHWRALELSADVPLPFNQVQFLRTWAEVMARHDQGTSPLVVAGWQGDQVSVLLPLTVRKSGGLKVAEWMGDPFCEYGDALVDPELKGDAALNAIADALDTINGVDVAHLRRVRSSSKLGQVLARFGQPVADPKESAVIDLSRLSSLDDYHATLSSKMRRELRRKRKKIAEEGDISFTVVTEPEARRESVRLALSFKAEWLEERGLVSQVFGNPATEEFLVELCDKPDAGLVITQLELDGKPVAIELGLRAAHRYFAYMGTYSPEHGHLAVGAMQMEDTISWCIDNKIKSYDLFAPADNYKRRWTPDGDTVQDYSIALTIPGTIALAYRRFVRPRAKAAFESLPASWRRTLSRLAIRIARI